MHGTAENLNFFIAFDRESISRLFDRSVQRPNF